MIKTFIFYMSICAHLQAGPGTWYNYQPVFAEKAKVLVFNNKVQSFFYV